MQSDSGRSDTATKVLSCDALIGRQAIYDTSLEIRAYELLFRQLSRDTADVVDGNAATATVLLNSLHVDASTFPPNRPLFVNCTREFLMLDPVLPPDRCVLEVLENIRIDEMVVTRLKQLKAIGYRIALDDFIYSDEFRPALELADYVKLDILDRTEQDLRAQLKHIRRYPAILLAEKIDSERQFALCQKLGFKLFQGYYLRRPEVLSRKRLKTNQMAALHLIRACNDPDIPIPQIARTIGCDLSLTHNLLRLANSAALAGHRTISSIPQAVQRVGTEKILRWAIVLSLASDSGCPAGYIEMALQRAHMCELIAKQTNAAGADSYFLIGLLSVLDSVMGVPIQQILAEIPLSPELQSAVLTGEGAAGQVLKLAAAYQNADWAAIGISHIPPSVLQNAYNESSLIASETLRSVVPGTKAPGTIPPTPVKASPLSM